MADCVFCCIASGAMPADILYEDNLVVAFRDIHPMSPIHDLIIPRAHIITLDDTKDEQLLGRMMVVATELARQEKISDSGYRLVINCGEEGGQVVQHLHLHLLGGRKLSTEMG